MRIEAFSEGKDLLVPEANEDQFLVLPGRGYAVIDGATDISGRRYDGQRGGWHASRVTRDAVAGFLLGTVGTDLTPGALIAHVAQALRACYAQHGLLEAARADPALRFGATLTLAADLGEVFRFVMIGDSGLRIDGTETFLCDSGLDLVTASLRMHACRHVMDAGGDAAARARVGRAAAFHGAAQLHPDMQPWLDEARLAALYEQSLAWCAVQLAHAPEADVRSLLDTGISGQTRFANNTRSPLSYAVLDGFDVPLPLVRVFDRPRAALRSIELFTDGYFAAGAAATVAAWEESFAEVERVDPEKIDRYPSMKGSGPNLNTDDRTVVIVHP